MAAKEGTAVGWLLEPSLDARPECWAGSWVELPAGPAPAAKVTSGAGAGRPQGLCPAAGGRGGAACPCPMLLSFVQTQAQEEVARFQLAAGPETQVPGMARPHVIPAVSRRSLGSPRVEGTPEQEEIVFVLKRTPQGLVAGTPHGPTCHRLGWGL